MCSCEIIRDWKSGDSLCYAFIEFDKVRILSSFTARKPQGGAAERPFPKGPLDGSTCLYLLVSITKRRQRNAYRFQLCNVCLLVEGSVAEAAGEVRSIKLYNDSKGIECNSLEFS